jgi:hypothetical protein
MWTRVRHFFDFLEHSWANNVIAYDRGSRDSLVTTLENSLTSAAVTTSQQVSDAPGWLRAQNFSISSRLISVLIALAVFALIVAVGWFVYRALADVAAGGADRRRQPARGGAAAPRAPARLLRRAGPAARAARPEPAAAPHADGIQRLAVVPSRPRRTTRSGG